MARALRESSSVFLPSIPRSQGCARTSVLWRSCLFRARTPLASQINADSRDWHVQMPLRGEAGEKEANGTACVFFFFYFLFLFLQKESERARARAHDFRRNSLISISPSFSLALSFCSLYIPNESNLFKNVSARFLSRSLHSPFIPDELAAICNPTREQLDKCDHNSHRVTLSITSR